jgi:TolB-like protein/Tfp pilus assembly protein PilF
MREAQAAAALDHPNICTVYEFDEAEEKTFISMAYVEGQSLRKKLESGPLELDEALKIALQVAKGLQIAHERGIVHRDIKSANIMVTKDNQAKIMDFGLARMTGGTLITRERMTMGTIAYMSPEQATGENVDHRTDIWSLGVVLYEILSGVLPFASTNEQATIYAVLNETPEPLSLHRNDIPNTLDKIVCKALEKIPSQRYDSLAELITNLHSISIETVSKKEKKPSIAVLPFVDMSPNKDQEYFGDGMAEEIINALTHINGLHVVARTSSFAFKGKNASIGEIAKELNVANILEGSVRKSGDKLRITAQLIKVADGYHLWSEKFDRSLEDIFDIQDEISLAIVAALKVKLLGNEKAAVVKRYTENLKAYDLYLKGRFYLDMFTPKGFEMATDFFEKSLLEDKNYAMAYIELGVTQRYMTLMGDISPRDCIPKMREYAEKALEIDNNLGDARCLLAIYHMTYDWNWTAANDEFEHALHLNPNSSYIYLYRSLYLMFMDNHEDSIAAIKHARELDPLSSLLKFQEGHLLYFAGHYDESEKALHNLIATNPNYYLPHFCLGYICRQRSQQDAAIAFYEKAYTLSGGISWTVMLLCTALYESGEKRRAGKLLKNLEERSKHEYVPPLCFYFIHRTFGNNEKASFWLEKAYKEHDGFLLYCRIFPDDTYRIPPDKRLTDSFKNRR